MVKVNSGVHEKMVVEIISTGDVIINSLSEVFRHYNITNSQFNILRILNGSFPEPISQNTIKERMVFNNPDISRLIDRLHTKELISRKPCPNNRRQNNITIEEKGIELVQLLNGEIKTKLNKFYSELFTEEEAVKLSDKLKQIRLTQTQN